MTKAKAWIIKESMSRRVELFSCNFVSLFVGRGGLLSPLYRVYTSVPIYPEQFWLHLCQSCRALTPAPDKLGKGYSESLRITPSHFESR